MSKGRRKADHFYGATTVEATTVEATTVEATTIPEPIERTLEKSETKNKLNFKVSIMLTVILTISFMPYLVHIIMVLNYLITKDLKSTMLLNQTSFICIIVMYYLTRLFKNITLSNEVVLEDKIDIFLNNSKSIILNIIGVVGFYNLLLAYNPLGVIELSSDYYISNLLYFYGSFLLFSIDYAIYNKITFIADIFFCLKIKLKSLLKKKIMIMLFFFIVYIGYFIYCFMREGVIFELIEGCLKLCLILMFIMLIKEDFSNVDEKDYDQLKKILNRYESTIKKITKWFLDVFKIDEIEPINITEKLDKLDKLKIAFIVLVKVVIPYTLFVIFISSKGLYYGMYEVDNENYCIGINEKIIKLKNGNVLITENEYDFAIDDGVMIWRKDKFYLTEIACKKNKIRMKIFE